MEELQVQVKEARLKLFGAEHLDTLDNTQVYLKETEELHARVEETCGMLGSEYPSMLESMVNFTSVPHDISIEPHQSSPYFLLYFWSVSLPYLHFNSLTTLFCIGSKHSCS